MFNSLFRSRRGHQSARTGLSFESLESRDCPSGLGGTGFGKILSLEVENPERRDLELTGRAWNEDGSPATGIQVTFTGKASGSAVTDSEGRYTHSTTGTELGNVTATATIQGDIITDQDAIESNAPAIVDHNAAYVGGGLMIYDFFGKVQDESPMGLQVEIRAGEDGTPRSLEDGEWALVMPDTKFTKSVELNQGIYDQGIVEMQVTDWWGLKSNVAQVYVNPNF